MCNCGNNKINISDCVPMTYQINLGRQFENNVGKIIFGCAEFINEYGIGTLQAVHKNSNDIEYTIPLVKFSDSIYEWIITDVDTSVSGYGELQLTYFVDDVKKKTAIIKTYVEKSLSEETVEPPEPLVPYVEKIMQIGAEVQADREATEYLKELTELSRIGTQIDAQKAEEAATRAEEAAERAIQAGLPTVGSVFDDVPTADGLGGWSWSQQKIKSVNGKTGNVVLNAGDVNAYNKTETDGKIIELNQYVVQELNSIDEKIDNLDIPTSLAELNQDTTHRTVTDTEKETWNGKVNESDLQEVEETLSAEIQSVDRKVPTELSQLSQNSNYRTVSDSEKVVWNSKSDFSGNYNDLTNKPLIPASLSELQADATHRTVTDDDKNNWNNKVDTETLEEVEETLHGEIVAVENKIPTELSHLNQNANYRTVSDTEKTYWGSKSDFSGRYDDLENKPTIPTKLSELQGDEAHRTVTDAEKVKWNSTVGFSGDYNDLTNKPTIPINLSQLNQDATHRIVTDLEKSAWNSKSDFSGSYNDLTNKPSIPQEYDDTEIKQSIQDLSETLTEETAVDETTISRNANNELQSVGNILISGGIQKYWKGYKSQFDAITVKDDNTLYEVLDDEETALFEVDGTTIEITDDSILRIPNNIDLMYQTMMYGNGESGYRKYRNGMLEQWGVATSSANGAAELTMHLPHIDTNFSIFVTPRERGNFFLYALPTVNQRFEVRIQSRDSQSMAVLFQWHSWGRWK